MDQPKSRLVFSYDDVRTALRDIDRVADKIMQDEFNYNYVDNSTTLSQNHSQLNSTKTKKNMKTCKFSTAVLLAIGSVRQQLNPFSVHDVTKKLREMVYDGSLSLSDRPIEDVDGVQTFRVDHLQVKEVFDDLFNNGVVTNLSVKYNALGYREYSDSMVAPAVSTAPQPKPFTLLAGPAFASTTFKAPPIPVRDVTHLSTLVKDFLKSKRGDAVSMKRIQSRFDRQRGVTCADYARIVKLMGLPVNYNSSSYPSKWTVNVPAQATF